MKYLILAALFSQNLFASEHHDFIAQIPNGTYEGFVESSDYDLTDNIECQVKIESSYSNKPNIKSIQISYKGNRSSSMSLNHKTFGNRHDIQNNGEYLSFNTEYSWAECCHSGGRYFAFINVLNRFEKKSLIQSIQMIQYEDIGPNYEEVQTFEGTCHLISPIIVE